MFSKILVVCVGNVCRSPYAEKVLAELLPESYISSAGIMVERCGLNGKGADLTGCTEALYRNRNMNKHKARQLTREMCLDAQLILVMESKHIEMVSKICYETTGKTMLLGKWNPVGSNEIIDPHGRDKETFKAVYDLIDSSCERWVEKLNM